MPESAPPRSQRLLRALVFALLALGLLRALGLLLNEPLIGLANNYDMIRVQRCVDVYPLRDASVPPWSNSWTAPLPRYHFRDDVPSQCFLTSETLFAFAALPLMHVAAARSDDGGFPLRLVGAVKLAALALLALALTLLLLREAGALAALAHAAVATLVIFDPGVTVYLNSFYSEFAAVYFAYATVALIAIARRRERPGVVLCVLIVLALLLACTSKIQHVVFGMIVLAVLVLSLRSGTRRLHPALLASVALGAVLGLVLQASHMSAASTVSIRHANLTNTVLLTVLPNSDDPARTAQTLGLPASCGEHAGKTWFTQGLQQNHPCPELLEMSRLRFLQLALFEPKVVARIYWGGIEHARPWTNGLLGLVAGSERAQLPSALPTLSDALQRLPLPAFAVLLLLPGLICGVALLPPWRRRLDAGMAFALLFCGLFPPLALGVVIFGDGYADTAKQFHLGMASLLAFWTLLPFALVALRRPPPTIAAATGN